MEINPLSSTYNIRPTANPNTTQAAPSTSLEGVDTAIFSAEAQSLADDGLGPQEPPTDPPDDGSGSGSGGG